MKSLKIQAGRSFGEARLELPDFEIDFSSDSGADRETNDKAVV